MLRTAAIRVLIADDSPAVRRGLRLRLDRADDITVVGETAAADAVSIAHTEQADVVVMDPQTPGGSGLAAIQELAGADVENPAVVVVLTTPSSSAFVFDALGSGATGYLLKTHDTDGLVDAIRSVACGRTVLSSRVTVPVMRELARRRREAARAVNASIGLLSPAEIDVVTQLSRGVTSNEAIAAALFVPVDAIRTHLASALKKTGFADRTQLALWGVRHSLDRVELGGDAEMVGE